MSEYIFDFTNPNLKIKGILSAVLDNEAIDRVMKNPFTTSKDYVVEVIAFIWIDENEEWNWKMRLKFPSGNKQIVFNNVGKDANETKCLHEMYQMPMIEKNWFANVSGDFEGMIKIMVKHDLIKTIEVRMKDEEIHNFRD